MAGRGAQSFQKRQKEQQRKEKQQEKMAKRLERKKLGLPLSTEEEDVLGPFAVEGDATDGETVADETGTAPRP